MPDEPVDSENRTQWIDWARAAADRLDPTRGDRALADIDFDIEPKPGDLRPFIEDWSPHEPHREYRSERDQQAIDNARLQADTWHHGMRPGNLVAQIAETGDGDVDQSGAGPW